MEQQQVIFSQIDFKELLEGLRNVVKEEINALKVSEAQDRLISPAEACKMFKPAISRVTLAKWTAAGLLEMQTIGGRNWYKESHVLEAGITHRRWKKIAV